MSFSLALSGSLSVLASRLDAQRAVPVRAVARVARDTIGAPPRARDAWFGRDKVRHFGSSAAIQLMGYGGLRASGASRRGSVVTASVLTLSAGVGKELWDARRGRQPSWRDLTWDVAGLVAGTGLAHIGDPR